MDFNQIANLLMLLIINAISALASLIFGVLFAHIFQFKLLANQKAMFQIALHYQQMYSFLLIVLCLLSITQKKLYKIKTFHFSLLLLTVGFIVFSCSLYALIFTRVSLFAYFAPVGGSCLILGWCFFIVSCVRIVKLYHCNDEGRFN